MSVEVPIKELTLRSIIIAIFLTIILALSNAYLALKLGILTSASIPAAIISMGILRFFKNSTIVENNIVQTAASAGEAVAGGIVYTIPALLIIHYWQGFDYITNFLIAFSGGVLGVLFSIPLRRILVHDETLKFPEGRAIAEVLKSSSEKMGIRDIVFGGLVGGVLELFQMGFKVIASSWNYWLLIKRSLFGLGLGFSATMIGAGFLVGHEMAMSFFLGAVIAYLVVMPLLSHSLPTILSQTPHDAAHLLWDSQLRYVGIGAMLFAGSWTFLKLLKPLARNIALSFDGFKPSRLRLRTDKDIPLPLILIGTVLIALLLFVFFQTIFPLETIGLSGFYASALVFGVVLYVLIMGFLFSVINSYLSGMVGVSASPGSATVIAGMLVLAFLLFFSMQHVLLVPSMQKPLQALEAITIITGSVVTGIAAIANDNSQDLKVGQLVGATPWRQQIMLLLGVLVSSLVIPPVMQLLYEVYGIAGNMPRAGMDPSQSLPAPTAALMAAITQAVFQKSIPWDMMLIGAAIIFGLVIIDTLLKGKRFFRFSPLGVAIGMYLPIASSFPLFLGGMMALLVEWRLNKKSFPKALTQLRKQRGILIACGLVAGSALVDVLLAIPFSILQSPNALTLVGQGWQPYGVVLGVISVILLFLWVNWRVSGGKDSETRQHIS